MAVQFPQRDIKEQRRVYQLFAESTMYPYSFNFNAGYVAANYPSISPSNAALIYFTMGFKADNNLAISGVDVAGFVAPPVGALGNVAWSIIEISYSPVFDSARLNVDAGVPAVPTTPTDTGNIIFRSLVTAPYAQAGALLSPYNFNFSRFYRPYNYLLKYNQILYMHIAVDAASAAVGNGQTVASIIFHALPTGLKI